MHLLGQKRYLYFAQNVVSFLWIMTKIANFLYCLFFCFGKFIMSVDVEPSKAKLLHVSDLFSIIEIVFLAKRCQSNIL